MHGTVGVFTAGRGKVGHLNKTFCLFLETPHQLGEGKATFVAKLPRKAAKITDGLKMDAPNCGGQLQGLLYHGPDRASIYSSHKGRDEDNAETFLSAVLDGPKFLVQERSSPQGAIDLIIYPIKLKKDR
jgi:hypothetical protein